MLEGVSSITYDDLITKRLSADFLAMSGCAISIVQAATDRDASPPLRTIKRSRRPGDRPRPITEDNIRDTVRQIRVALLEADVALPVAKAFIERVHVRALSEEVAKSLNPG